VEGVAGGARGQTSGLLSSVVDELRVAAQLLQRVEGGEDPGSLAAGGQRARHFGRQEMLIEERLEIRQATKYQLRQEETEAQA
jgi:hypothetical protein